jgi:hypothetical protein
MKVWMVFELVDDWEGYMHFELCDVFDTQEKAVSAYPDAVLRTRESISTDYDEHLPELILEEVEVK